MTALEGLELAKRLRAATMRFDWGDLPEDAAIPAVPLLREAAAFLERSGLPSPCSLTVDDAVVHAAYNSDEEAKAVFDILGAQPVERSGNTPGVTEDIAKAYRTAQLRNVKNPFDVFRSGYEAALSAALPLASVEQGKTAPHVMQFCATDGCQNLASHRFEAGGIGSWYCVKCYAAIVEQDGKWEIDRTTESPILTYEKCSVIQDEQALYVLNLIRAIQSPPAAGRVKALEWTHVPRGKYVGITYRADSILGEYLAQKGRAYFNNELIEADGPRLVDGKAAAQAHLDAAILSALAAPVEAVATEPVAERLTLPDGVEIGEFKPCISVNEETGLTEFISEDVTYVAEPLFPGIHHWIDKHVAMDDGRLVGMAIWATAPPLAAPAEAVATEPVAEHGYATRLLVSLMEKHYPDRHPEWAPLPDLMGVLTQIDNMSTGLVRAPSGDSVALREALAAGCYMMSEPHLSGYRLIIGFETLPAVQDAMQAVVTALSAPLPIKTGTGSTGDGE